MSGRPVQLFAAAALAAVASTATMSTASAGCYSSCGSSYSYAAPVAYYSAPVVYSYSYAAPVSYAAPCSNPCGYSYGYAVAPSYVVNQGPTYSEPVTIGVAPTQSYDYGYRRAYPYYAGGGGLRWHHRRWYRHHGYGYRQSYGYRRSYGLRYGYGVRHGYRAGIVMPGYRHGWRMRQPMVGPGMWRAPRYRTGLIVPPRLGGGPIPPRHWNAVVRPHRMGMPQHRMMQQDRMGGQPMMRQPGWVHPQKKMP